MKTGESRATCSTSPSFNINTARIWYVVYKRAEKNFVHELFYVFLAEEQFTTNFVVLFYSNRRMHDARHMAGMQCLRQRVLAKIQIRGQYPNFPRFSVDALRELRISQVSLRLCHLLLLACLLWCVWLHMASCCTSHQTVARLLQKKPAWHIS